MKIFHWALALFFSVLTLAACGAPIPSATATPAPQTAAPASTATRVPATQVPIPRAQVIVLSNSKPHVSVIDAETNQVAKTADIPNFTSWTWNDDNNYYDGKNLWLGLRNPDSNDVEVILLDLDSLQVTKHIPLGQDKITLYIGKLSREGKVFVSKHASGQIAVIDAKTLEILKIVDLPVNGGVACDVDIAVGPDGKERAFVPTDNSNLVLSIDTSNYQVLQTLTIPEGTRPFMLTTSPDGKRVWVQERNANGNVVLDTTNLQVIQRIPTGKGAIVNTFSADGKLSLTGHSTDTFVTAHDSETFKEVWRAQVGSNPDKVGVHPNGKWIYAIVNKEAAVVVLETATGKTVTRISIGTNPSGIFVRALK